LEQKNLRLSEPKRCKLYLIGGFNPSEKYARQNGNLPQIGVKIKTSLIHILNHHLVICFLPPKKNHPKKKR